MIGYLEELSDGRKEVLDAAIAENSQTEDCKQSSKSHLKHANNKAEEFTLPLYLPREEG